MNRLSAGRRHRPGRTGRRLRALTSSAAAQPSTRPEGLDAAPMPRARSAALLGRTAPVAAVLGGAALAGMTGTLLGAAVGLGVWWATRHGGSPTRLDPGEVALVADLAAGSLAAGSGMPDALRAAAVVASDELATMCRHCAARLSHGEPVEVAWLPWRARPATAVVARIAVRTSVSGAAAATELRAAAARLRRTESAEARRRVARAGVWVVLPLGTCFLPAFVLVAVVPLVAGLLPHW